VKYAACLALALALCAVGLSGAEDKAPLSNYKHLKGLEPLIGTWTGERDFPQDWPTANIKKGKYPFTVTFKWDAKKSAISSHHSIGRPGSAPLWKAVWLVGWDTANKRIVGIGFEATGGHALTHDWEIQGDKVTFKGRGSLPAGNKTAWTMIFSDIKKDTCVYQLTDMTVDGKKAPGHHKVTLKRARAR
jgi:hypothetical protein